MTSIESDSKWETPMPSPMTAQSTVINPVLATLMLVSNSFDDPGLMKTGDPMD